ncbi:MAG: CBS domain-containing protein [Deltaproteobacteria bacterium]|nr:CBS domain-containing protein [Deltaproteobacteria bacterium]MBW2137084.1 CBS domain-containing protein [Deltaproteobacteria bacterium]
MEEIIAVSDIMVPFEEYATVSEDATLYEAVMELERAQEELDRKRYHYLHRAILVYDRENRIVGKISQLDVLKALEPKYKDMGDMRTLSRAGFSPQFLKSMMEQFHLCDSSFTEMCCRAAAMKVKDFMYTPTEGEYVEEDATLCEAIHQLVMGQHQSLLVTRDGEIVGILRLTDVFKEVFQSMKKHCQEPR